MDYFYSSRKGLSRFSRAIPVTGSDFGPHMKCGRSYGGGSREAFLNKGGTAYYTPFAGIALAEGFFVARKETKHPAQQGIWFHPSVHVPNLRSKFGIRSEARTCRRACMFRICGANLESEAKRGHAKIRAAQLRHLRSR